VVVLGPLQAGAFLLPPLATDRLDVIGVPAIAQRLAAIGAEPSEHRVQHLELLLT
jgi:hypothetical protein